MHYVKKYLGEFHVNMANGITTNPARKGGNILLYCNYYSYYSQKVLMALYEKNIEFEPYIIDITKGEQYSSWFLDINPRGEIPVLKVENQTIPDSARILDYLEDHLYPELTPLVYVSTDPKVLRDIEKFRDLVEALPAGVITVGSFFHPHLCGRPKMPFVRPVREILKSGDLGSAQALRNLAEEHPHAKHILLYKADIHDRKHVIYSNESEYLKILSVIDQVLTEVEEQLKNQGEGNWLCCENFTIADINVAILLQRLWELGLEDRFWANEKRPYVQQYYNRVSQRESFKKTIPSIGSHLKMIINSQPPLYVSAAGVATVGLVLTLLYAIKKVLY